MPDDATTGQQADALLVIPPATLSAFPEFIELITHSASMNTDERQYWIDILPDMTEDQLAQLHAILINEKNQHTSNDATSASKTIDSAATEQTTEERLQRARERAEKEQTDRVSEQAEAERALKESE